MRRESTLKWIWLIAAIALTIVAAEDVETTTQITTTEAVTTLETTTIPTKVDDGVNKVVKDKPETATTGKPETMAKPETTAKPNKPPFIGVRGGPFGPNSFAGPFGNGGGFYGFGVQTTDGNGAGASSFAGASSAANGFGSFGGVGSGPGGYGFPNSFQGSWGPGGFSGGANPAFGYPGAWGGNWGPHPQNSIPPKDPKNPSKGADGISADKPNSPVGVHTRFGEDTPPGVFGYPPGSGFWRPGGMPTFGFDGAGSVGKDGKTVGADPTADGSDPKVIVDTPNVHIVHGNFEGPGSFGSFAGFGTGGFGFPPGFAHWGPAAPPLGTNDAVNPKSKDGVPDATDKPNTVDLKIGDKDKQKNPGPTAGPVGPGYPGNNFGAFGSSGGFAGSGSFAGPGFGGFSGPNGFVPLGLPPHLASRFGGPANTPNTVTSNGVTISVTSSNDADKPNEVDPKTDEKDNPKGKEKSPAPNAGPVGFGFPGNFGGFGSAGSFAGSGFGGSGNFASPGFAGFPGPNSFGNFGFPPQLASRFGGPADGNVAGAATSNGVSVSATSTNGTDTAVSGTASFIGTDGVGGYTAFAGPNGFSGGFGFPGGFGQRGGFRAPYGTYG